MEWISGSDKKTVQFYQQENISPRIYPWVRQGVASLNGFIRFLGLFLFAIDFN
jgi:hypothetical protein